MIDFFNRSKSFVSYCEFCKSQKLFIYDRLFNYRYCSSCNNAWFPFVVYFDSWILDRKALGAVECSVSYHPERLICLDCDRYAICKHHNIIDDVEPSGDNMRLF